MEPLKKEKYPENFEALFCKIWVSLIRKMEN